MNSRQQILNKLRTARDAGKGAHQLPLPDVGGFYAAVTAPDMVTRIELLRSTLDTAHAEVIVAGARDWCAPLLSKLQDHGVKRLLINRDSTQAQQLIAAIDATDGGITTRAFDQAIEQWKAELFTEIDAGFTVVDCAIAETGTLVLKSSPVLPRTMSLVPPLHVALVRADTVHFNLFSAAQSEGWAAAMPSNLVMISSPSKTSDIQQTLAYGAHGPKHLLVVIVTPDQGELA